MKKSEILCALPKLTTGELVEVEQRLHEIHVADGSFRYRAEECDVINKERLRAFRVEKLKWLFWLHGDTHHSIFNQITSLLWDYALFQTLNDLRVRAAKNKLEGLGFNAPTLMLLDSGFVAKQAMGIRRLTDRADDVISLKRLVLDINKHRELISREVFVAHDGLPYDYAVVKEEYYAEKLKRGEGGWCEGVETTGAKAWHASERMHEVFDRMSGTPSTQRTRDDLIAECCFEDLNSTLGACNGLHKFADKFIAHAAGADSRAELPADFKSVTLGKLARCLQATTTVAGSISRWILGDGTSWKVPQPQFDPLQNLDQGWVAKGALGEAHELWNQHMATVEQWSDASVAPVRSSPAK